MFFISLNKSRTIEIAGRLGRVTELHFNQQGAPVAVRILFATRYVIHKLQNNRLPSGWAPQKGGISVAIFEHDSIDFQSKLNIALRHAVCV